MIKRVAIIGVVFANDSIPTTKCLTAATLARCKLYQVCEDISSYDARGLTVNCHVKNDKDRIWKTYIIEIL